MDFNQKYGKKWYHIENLLFFRYLISSLIVVFTVIFYLANHTYNKEDIYQIIGDRYIEYVVSLNNTFNDNSDKPEFYDVNTKSKTEKATDVIQNSNNAAKSGKADRNNGLLSADDFEILSYETEKIAPPTRFFKKSNRQRSNNITDPNARIELTPYEYKIDRSAGLYLDIPEYLLEEKPKYVYRDQENVLKVIYSQGGIIESCYQKAARWSWVQPGFVKVEFQIASDGYVLPSSIKILDSTIKNKQVEQCIKKTIGRWHGFKKLKKNPGIAHVVHKFVFN